MQDKKGSVNKQYLSPNVLVQVFEQDEVVRTSLETTKEVGTEWNRSWE